MTIVDNRISSSLATFQFKPAGSGTQRRYSYRDLVALKVIKSLLDAGVALKTARVAPDAAFYHHDLNEFILPYEAVRTADAPAAAITAFIESTYDRAATLAGWDRAALERPIQQVRA